MLKTCLASPSDGAVIREQREAPGDFRRPVSHSMTPAPGDLRALQPEGYASPEAFIRGQFPLWFEAEVVAGVGSERGRGQLGEALRAADLETYPICQDRAEDRTEPGGRLATTKGLEFDRVLIADVSDGIVPHDRALSDADDEATREQIRTREGSLLYVAATRAKRDVIVTCHDESSPWIARVHDQTA